MPNLLTAYFDEFLVKDSYGLLPKIHQKKQLADLKGRTNLKLR